MRPFIDVNLKGLNLMWIRGWKFNVLSAWIDISPLDNPEETWYNWWYYRPWKNRRNSEKN